MTDLLDELYERVIPAPMATNEQRDANARRTTRNDGYECILCGAYMTKKGMEKAFVVHLVGGGSSLAPVDAEWPDADMGDMGWLEIGSDCARKVPAEYKTKRRDHFAAYGEV